MQNPSVHSSLTRQIAFASLALAVFCTFAASLLAQTPTPVTVPTWRYDLTHAGQNTNETALDAGKRERKLVWQAVLASGGQHGIRAAALCARAENE